MKSLSRIGIASELEFIVEPQHCIEFATDGMPPVLSTPNLVGWLECTARQALEPALEADERSVGIEVELRHFAPTPPGQRVTCTARVIHAEGKQITFQIEARDAHELIARGVHTRAVIKPESFSRRVRRKAS